MELLSAILTTLYIAIKLHIYFDASHIDRIFRQ